MPTPVLLAELVRDRKFLTLGLTGTCDCTPEVLQWLDSAVVGSYFLGLKPFRIVVCADTHFGYQALHRVAEVRKAFARSKVVVVATPYMWDSYCRALKDRVRTNSRALFARAIDEFGKQELSAQ